MDLLELLARPVFLLARFLLWLTLDFLVLTIAWWIGWPILRLLSVGRFPHVGLGEYEDSGTLEAILACSVGFLILAAVIWYLSTQFGW